MNPDIRADQLLVAQNLLNSRTRAQQAIAAKRVHYRRGSDWILLTKPSLKLSLATQFRLESCESDRYVSRGGLKLAGALMSVKLDVSGLLVLDVGQSTGGFTDCLLQAGSAKVVGVDVGHDQLADELRNHPQVVYFEGINARRLSGELLLPHTGGKGFDLAVMDVSFISQTLILPSVVPLLKPGGQLISLVKPQFEVGKAGVGKGGLVRDPFFFNKVKEKISACCQNLGLTVVDYRESAITGGDGNREFIIYARDDGGMT